MTTTTPGIDFENLTLREALGEALKAEERAKDFFDRVLVRVRNPDVGRLFAELVDEEVEHRQLVLAEMAALPEPRRRRGHDREQTPG
ncbi:MAG: hypothetical protein H6Q89_2166 [Myxococcaceae bacterium]|nr:hypothetical protein [Myxococcaceae bacterium]